ncbi:hypothetical protein, partial [Clostridium sp. 3-3]|uniref:hypothetical protein n=1 Tax=Clostridium sp. 3-3 TaxID=2070757 RepID=UPI001A9A3B7D
YIHGLTFITKYYFTYVHYFILTPGDFNIPTKFCFYKKKNGSFDCYFKTSVRLLYFVKAHKNPATTTTVFLLPLGGIAY